MINEILLEESIIGWKEYELEVMRDNKDNVVIVCSIENLDEMGVHTGDSITVAPAQTLSDKEYQQMRDAALMIMREIGVETGGSNVQFATDPKTGRMVVIEMNPRVSRSSALASKATGFPIAKFAAKLAVGYSLDEIQNDITKETPASFEPTIDYCVVKIPRFTFEKFPEAQDVLSVQMKSVGETMAIGRTFKEALQKGLRGLEIGHAGLDNKWDYRDISSAKLHNRLQEPNASRIFYIKYALQKGWTPEEVAEVSRIDIWFIFHMAQLVELEKEIMQQVQANATIETDLLRKAKQWGFSDAQLAAIMHISETDMRKLRKDKAVVATFKLVDTCAAEFEAYTPYLYSTYEEEDEASVQIAKAQSQENAPRQKIMILGGGPNRIGQGIEFDYCCCHASFALKELGYESIMVNSNPETVSTDYDISDRLYFEPLTFEDVMNIIDVEKPDGVIVQFGGQTPLNLAHCLNSVGVPIIGTSVESIELAENREMFSSVINKLGLIQPANGSTTDKDKAIEIAETIGYPVLVRPSFVLGGRAMKIVYSRQELVSFVQEAQTAAQGKPILIDKFIEDAIEVDVDAISDGGTAFVAGIMEHIENAGVHSGDSACVLPPTTVSENVIEQIKTFTCQIAKELQVVGLLNIQFALKGRQIFVLEVNPRASRTSPFVSKATGIPLAKIAAKLMLGRKLSEFGLSYEKLAAAKHICVKESVLPFSRFSGVDIVLGPEMKSTGEVMGSAMSFGEAFAKSQISAGSKVPQEGTVFLSVRDEDKRAAILVAKKFQDLKFSILSTRGTARVLRANGVVVEEVERYDQGKNIYSNLMTLLKENKIGLIINTPSGERSQSDMRFIRAAAILHNVPCITTLQGAWAALNGIESKNQKKFSVQSLQRYYQGEGKTQYKEFVS
jgi:carbamoyl-phosphate synthase large subunit